MESKYLDLVEIVKIIYKKKWFILIFGVAALVVGLIFSTVAPKKYSSRTVFIVKSPSIFDRNQIFAQGYYQTHEYFGNEVDVDNVMTIAQNKDLERRLVDSFKLVHYYGVKEREQAVARLHKGFKITRNDTRSIEFRFTDKDPQMAANLANAARIFTLDSYGRFFTETRERFIKGFDENIQSVDQEISNTDDSIQNIRNQFGLFNVLLPTRGQTLQPQVSGLTPDKVRGMEELQKLTDIKDQLTKDRAKYVSLVNEYKLDNSDAGSDLLFSVEDGQVQDDPTFPNIPLILAICLVGGIGFAVILVLIMAQLKKLTEEK